MIDVALSLKMDGPIRFRRILSMSHRLIMAATVAALTISGFSVPVFAAGGDSSTPTCKEGEVYNKDKKVCEPAKQGSVDDDSLYRDRPRRWPMAGRYGEAIEMLGLISDKTDPRVLNMLGYLAPQVRPHRDWPRLL
jgi:hypothetical protein